MTWEVPPHRPGWTYERPMFTVAQINGRISPRSFETKENGELAEYHYSASFFILMHTQTCIKIDSFNDLYYLHSRLFVVY